MSTIRNAKAQIVGWINTAGDCENPTCRAAIAAGRPVHAIPAGFAATLPDYHFATANDAINALLEKNSVAEPVTAPEQTAADDIRALVDTLPHVTMRDVRRVMTEMMMAATPKTTGPAVVDAIMDELRRIELERASVAAAARVIGGAR